MCRGVQISHPFEGIKTYAKGPRRCEMKTVMVETTLGIYTIHKKQELSRIQRFQDASLDRQPSRDIILPVAVRCGLLSY